MGVTPTNGGVIPLYILSISRLLWQSRVGSSTRMSRVTHPLIPSFAIVFRTTSTAPVYVPGGAVCSRVLVRSKGWPTRTHETPPKPPERKDLTGFWVCLDEDASISELSSDMVMWVLLGGGRVARLV